MEDTIRYEVYDDNGEIVDVYEVGKRGINAVVFDRINVVNKSEQCQNIGRQKMGQL